MPLLRYLIYSLLLVFPALLSAAEVFDIEALKREREAEIRRMQVLEGERDRVSALEQQKTEEMRRIQRSLEALFGDVRKFDINAPESVAILAKAKPLQEQYAQLDLEQHPLRVRYTELTRQLSQEHRLVIYAVASGIALTEGLYAGYRSTLKNEVAAVLPPQTFSDAIRSDEVIARMLSGESQLGIIDRLLSAKESAAFAQMEAHRDALPLQTPFARGVTVVVVHARNPVVGMDLDRLEAMYRNHEGSWRDLGGPARPIERLGSTPPFLSEGMFVRQVLQSRLVSFPDRFVPEGGGNVIQAHEEAAYQAFQREQRDRFPGRGAFPRYNDDLKVAELVAERPDAIGYCLLLPKGYPAGLPDGGLPAGVKALALAPRGGGRAVPPDALHIVSGEYPLMRTLYLVVRPDAGQVARAFARFVLSDASARAIAGYGLHPIIGREAELGPEREAAYKRGEGPRLTVAGPATMRAMMEDVALAHARARVPVQVSLQSQDAVGEFLAGRRHLLLAEGALSSVAQPRQVAALLELGASSTVIAARAVAVIVPPGNASPAFTLEQLRAIFQGRTRQWDHASGVAGEIALFGPDRQDPVNTLWRDVVLGGSARMARVDARRTAADLVSAVLFEPQAISFIDAAALDPAQVYSEDNLSGLRVLAIEVGNRWIALEPTTLRDGSYPLGRTLTLWIHPEANASSRSLADFLSTASLDTVFRTHGLIQVRQTGP